MDAIGVSIKKEWERDNNHTPIPHFVKERIIKEIAFENSLKTFIESGTYFGMMIDALKNDFETIISIELSEDLASAAKKRFSRFSNITILQGDSGEKISIILQNLTRPALFWLDGHYYGGVTAKAKIETPIVMELKKFSNNQ